MQISKLYHVDCFCLSFYSENLLREELGTTVCRQKEMDTAFSNMKTKLCSSFYLIGSSKVSHFSNQRPLLLVFSFEFSRLKWPKVLPVDYKSNYKYFPGHVTQKFRAIDELRKQMALLSLDEAGLGIQPSWHFIDCQAIHFPKFNQATNKCSGQFEKMV